ncbi:MAG: hypothetical protein O2816_18300, partial [Planctomycetota bacterium]|nr:hypothetical protein [Planctomycetota bacterium]
DYGIQVSYDTPIFSVEKREGLFHLKGREFSATARTCVIAIGVFGKPKRPDYKIPRVPDRWYTAFSGSHRG